MENRSDHEHDDDQHRKGQHRTDHLARAQLGRHIFGYNSKDGVKEFQIQNLKFQITLHAV